jgi:hypothetical protein
VVSTFTAGIDSYFTVLRHPECKHYVNILGLDMPLRNLAAHGRLLTRLRNAAARQGAEMIPMSTNLRETRWGNLPWETFSSGAALAGTLLVLEKAFGKILIPSTFDFGNLIPWGSHPLSDPLYSTSTTQVIHDGTSHSRAEKTEFLIQNEDVLQNLHVCFQGQDARGQDDTNCCNCAKCYRTMIVLEILGKLRDCALFDAGKFEVARIAHLDTSTPVQVAFYKELKTLALERGRQDIATAIQRSLTRSRWIAKCDVLQDTRLLWRIPRTLRALSFGDFKVLNRG